jgi:hypothetical protein
MTTRGRILALVLWTALVLFVGHLLGADNVDSETGKPVKADVVKYEDGSTVTYQGDKEIATTPATNDPTVTIHVSGHEIGYEAEEDTAYCVAPSVELSYTSNEDGSGTIVCSVP